MTLRRRIEQASGLAPDAAGIGRAVRERMAQLGLKDRADYAPVPGSAEFDALLDLLVVPESWMMRDPAVFGEALRFVSARAQRQPLRVLSLPCAGGEEPYSMAMTLLDAGIPPERCRIDAVDVSAAAIERARAGRYGRNAFRGADLAFRARHFALDGDAWVIGAAARAYVEFRQASLFALEGAPARYDLVFCRNLLIYFDAATADRAAAVLKGLLREDGLLLSGYAEAPSFCRNGFIAGAPGAPFALSVQEARAAAPRSILRAAALPLRAEHAAAAPAFAPAFVPAFVPAPAFAPAPLSRPAPAELLAGAQRLADRGRLQEAEGACNALLERLPEHAGAWFLLGMIQESAGRERAAERSWRRCVYLDPGHYEALCGLALLHERMGDAVRGAGFRRRAARVFERRPGGSAA